MKISHYSDEPIARLTKAIGEGWVAIDRMTRALAATTDLFLIKQIRRNRIEQMKNIRYCRLNIKTWDTER